MYQTLLFDLHVCSNIYEMHIFVIPDVFSFIQKMSKMLKLMHYLLPAQLHFKIRVVLLLLILKRHLPVFLLRI